MTKLTPRDRATIEAFAQALLDHAGKPLLERSVAVAAQMITQLEAQGFRADKPRRIMLSNRTVVLVEVDEWERVMTAAAKYARCDLAVIGQLVHGIDGLFEIFADRFHEMAVRYIEQRATWKPCS